MQQEDAVHLLSRFTFCDIYIYIYTYTTKHMTETLTNSVMLVSLIVPLCSVSSYLKHVSYIQAIVASDTN